MPSARPSAKLPASLAPAFLAKLVSTVPSMALPTLLAAAAVSLGPAPAAAETYQNDGLVDNSLAGFQGGFIVGEMAAACFTPPEDEYPIQLVAAQLLFGGDREGATIFGNMKVFDTGGGGTPPSGLVADIQDIEFVSSVTALNEVDLTSYGITVTRPWCVAVEMQRDGLPSVARDDDGTINAGNNWIYAIDRTLGPLGWMRSADLGLSGDWVIRTIGNPRRTGPGPTDTGTRDTGTPDTGTPDTGTPDTDTPDTGTPDAALAIQITDVEQSSEDPGEDIEVTIIGRGFQPAFRYRVGPRTLSDVSVSGDTEAVGILAAGTLDPGSWDVTVRGDFGEVSFSDGVFLRDTAQAVPAPTVTSVTPSATELGSSASIVVLGDNFVAGVMILIDGRPLPGAQAPTSPQALPGFVPGDHVDSPGRYELVVRNPDGQTSLPVTFEFRSTSGGNRGGCATGPAAGGLSLLGLLALALTRRRG